MRWPTDVWPLLLQCKLSGKAQDVVSALSLEESLRYDCVKSAVLRAYELVPEAYRHRYRNYHKAPTKSYVDFTREKETLFDRWCNASKVTDFVTLRVLVPLEEFKNGLPEWLVLHLNEQKVVSLAQAAVLADEFVLTHKTVFTAPQREPARELDERRFFAHPAKQREERIGNNYQRPREERECYYCHRRGHVLADCWA